MINNMKKVSATDTILKKIKCDITQTQEYNNSNHHFNFQNDSIPESTIVSPNVPVMDNEDSKDEEKETSIEQNIQTRSRSVASTSRKNSLILTETIPLPTPACFAA